MGYSSYLRKLKTVPDSFVAINLLKEESGAVAC